MSKQEKFIKDTKEGKHSSIAKDIMLTIAIILGSLITETILDSAHQADGHFNGAFFVGIIALLISIKVIYHIGVKISTKLFYLFEKRVKK